MTAISLAETKPLAIARFAETFSAESPTYEARLSESNGARLVPPMRLNATA